jgi:ElaB/YqjD/DUF883 family membrane-anchored ribosome-binding protein
MSDYTRPFDPDLPHDGPPDSQPRLAEDLVNETASAREAAFEARAHSDINRLKADLDSLRRDLASLSGTLREVAMARGEEGAAIVRDYAEQARGHAEDYMAEAERAVVRNPLVSVAAAFGIGYIAGRIMGRDCSGGGNHRGTEGAGPLRRRR